MHTWKCAHNFLNMKKLNIYTTAGFPQLEDTLAVMHTIQNAGADIIELGIPYSDPVADGPVIQAASKKALENGMSIHVLFSQLEDMRKTITIPVYLMGYFNPVLQYGVDQIVAKAADVGITGLIIPDLPPAVFDREYRSLFEKYGLNFVCLVTPETSEERIRYLDRLSSGFLYAVSSSSTTGNNKDLSAQEAYFKKLASLNLQNEILVGFGIHDKASFEVATQHVSGGIIGSAFVEILKEKPGEWNLLAAQFIGNIR